MTDPMLAIRLQAHTIRATLDEPRVGSLPAVLGGLALAVGAMVAISWLGGHAAQGLRVLEAATRALAQVIEGR